MTMVDLDFDWPLQMKQMVSLADNVRYFCRRVDLLVKSLTIYNEARTIAEKVEHGGWKVQNAGGRGCSNQRVLAVQGWFNLFAKVLKLWFF